MSKKRRTRAQKIRSAQRRQDGEATQIKVPADIKPKQPLSVTAARPVAAANKNNPKQQLATEAGLTKRRQPSDLRLSLAIFGSLAAIQLLLWLIFSLSDIDASLYRLIKF